MGNKPLEDIEIKAQSQSRFKSAARSAVEWGGFGAIIGYVSHLFFGKPQDNGFILSQKAAKTTAIDAAFFATVGAILGAIWPNKFGGRTQNVEITFKQMILHLSQYRHRALKRMNTTPPLPANRRLPRWKNNAQLKRLIAAHLKAPFPAPATP